MIQLTQLIRAQLYESVMMFISGMAFMIFYEGFTFVIHKAGVKKTAACISELLFWVAASFLTNAFLYKCAFGKISVHVLAAFVLGAWLWRIFFYGILKSGETDVQKKSPSEQRVAQEQSKL